MASPSFPLMVAAPTGCITPAARVKASVLPRRLVDAPLHWHEHSASPVLTPREDNWEGNMINQPRVVKVTNEHWRMYYTGWGFAGPGTPWALGLAESFDGGTSWQRCRHDPILPRGDASSPDGAGACVPMVLRVAERWMMWYTAGQLHPAGHQHIPPLSCHLRRRRALGEVPRQPGVER